MTVEVTTNDSTQIGDKHGPGLLVVNKGAYRNLMAMVFQSREARDTAAKKIKEALALATAVS